MQEKKAICVSKYFKALQKKSSKNYSLTLHSVDSLNGFILSYLACAIISDWKGILMHKVVDLCQLVYGWVNYCRFLREKQLQNGIKNWYLCAALIVYWHSAINHNYRLMCLKLLFFARGKRVTKQITQWIGKNDYLPTDCTNYMNYSNSASLWYSFVFICNICTFAGAIMQT